MRHVALGLLAFACLSCAYAGEWYFSWGNSRDFWARSDIHIVQESLGNNFTVHRVTAVDVPDYSNYGFGGQYNFRLGRFIDAQHHWAIELNFDHTKYNSNINQIAYVDGQINNQYFAGSQVLTLQYFDYQLLNGLNHFMLNAVRRFPLIGETNKTFSLAGLLKMGVGVVLPHAENLILGHRNNVGPKAWGNYLGWRSGWWQMGGWTAGVEAGVRFVIVKPVYVELTDKEVYTSISDIPVYQGRANQNVWMNEVIFSLGVTV